MKHRMSKWRWRFITFKPWRFIFFKLVAIEEINDNHTRYVYIPRTFKKLTSEVKVKGNVV